MREIARLFCLDGFPLFFSLLYLGFAFPLGLVREKRKYLCTRMFGSLHTLFKMQAGPSLRFDQVAPLLMLHLTWLEIVTHTTSSPLLQWRVGTGDTR